MPQTLTPEDLQAVGGPIAAGLLPAWRVSWVLLSQADLDALRPPGPNLAVVQSLPERRMATANVVNPWPEDESLSETLHHELGHSWISPLTKQIPETEASVMLEEQLVETLGVYLASLTGEAATAARRALAKVVDEAPARWRARISARAPLARGAGMDPKMVMEALDALIEEGGGDGKCAAILKSIIAAQAGGGAVPAEPDGDEAALKSAEGDGAPMAAEMSKPPEAGAAKPVGEPKPAEATRVAARVAQIEGEYARARKAANAGVGVTIRARLRELRTDGVALSTAKEEELSKMVDLDRFEERVADILEGRKLAAPGGTRARAQVPGGPVQNGGAPPPVVDFGAAPPVSAEQLRAEGADESFVQMYTTVAERDPSGAAGLLAGFREPTAVAARARIAAKGPAGRAHGRPS